MKGQAATGVVRALVILAVCELAPIAVSGCAESQRHPAANASNGAVKEATVRRPGERVVPSPEVNPQAVMWRTARPPADPRPGDVWVDPKASMEMVYVPPGEFTLGTTDVQVDAWLKQDQDPHVRREAFRNEQPAVCMANPEGYWIGRTEVTNAQYQRFTDATTYHYTPSYWEGRKAPADLRNYPVQDVSWEDATAYCDWARLSLPTEWQWEKAARGTGGRLFPWGNQWDPARCADFASISGKTFAGVDALMSGQDEWAEHHDSLREGIAPVGSRPAGASPYGCLDMAGNVSEWCEDWWEETAYQRYARGDLTLPPSGRMKALRGGKWMDVGPFVFRCARRDWGLPGGLLVGGGFRCVRNLR